ncbi:MAG: N-acetyltransferase [Pedobacter sp.]|nr:MAG: N-acetyltransferase [Pedobacter sp.]
MLSISFPTLPLLETSRLILREQTLLDAPSLFSLRTNNEVMRYIDRVKPKTVEESKDVLQTMKEGQAKGLNLVWAITLKGAPKNMIGNVGFWRTDAANHRAEIGYILHPDYWRKGILSEALSEVIRFGFETVKLHSMCANINPKNDASRQLLLKHGFLKEAYFREDYYFDGKYLDSEIYGLLR